MVDRGTAPASSVLRHPAVVWALPATALLVVVSMPVNDGFYEYWVNFDPQGDAQQHEWHYATRIFRYTSGVLCGQLLAFVAGTVLAGRRRQVVALATAVPLAVVMAAVTVAVAYPLARSGEGGYFTTGALDDPVLVRVLAVELAAFPLYAAAGVGFGAVVDRVPRRARWALAVVLGLGWCLATLTGLLQDDRFGAPVWLLWTVPPVAAGTAVALAGLSVDVWADQARLVGDQGRSAGIALVASAMVYAVVLNVAGGLLRRRRPG